LSIPGFYEWSYMDKLPARTELNANAPAPHIEELKTEHGNFRATQAFRAWSLKVSGEGICDIAHQTGLSIEGAKALIKEAHTAIREDLKENLELNRQLDLDRVDGLLKTYYSSAKAGDEKAASLVLKCLERRAKLTGVEPEPQVNRAEPQNVLIWIQQQLPTINRFVDSLPND
jgi:hypothetical protein